MFGRSCLVLIGFVSVVKAAVPPIPKATFSTSAVDTKGVRISSLTSGEGINVPHWLLAVFAGAAGRILAD